MPVSDMLLTGVGKGYVLGSATSLWQAKNYSGSGAWLDEIGSADFQFGSTSGSDTNDPLWLPHSTSQNPFGAGVDYTYFPGISGNYVSTPDTAALDITGDITLVAHIAPDDWTPTASFIPIGKNNAATQRSYHLAVITTGELRLTWSTTGADYPYATSTIATGFTDGTARWIAASLDVNDGAGNHVVKFWTSTNGSSWSQLGSTVTTAGTTSIWSGTEPLTVGGVVSGTSSLWSGKIARAQVYDGVRDFSGTPSGGTLVADFNPNGGTINSTQTSLTGTGDGLTWTFNRAATGRKLAVVDEDKFLLGTDDYFTTPDSSDLEFGTSTDWSAVIVARRFDAGDAQDHLGLRKRSNDANEYGWQVRITGSTRVIYTIEKDATGLSYDSSSGLTYTLGERATVTGVSSRTDATIQSYLGTTAGTAATSVTARDTDGTTTLDVGRTLNTSSYYTDCEIVALAIFKGKALTSGEVAQVVSELA